MPSKLKAITNPREKKCEMCGDYSEQWVKYSMEDGTGWYFCNNECLLCWLRDLCDFDEEEWEEIDDALKKVTEHHHK